MTSITLKSACEIINDLTNADNSKLVWKNALITLTHYYIQGEDAPNTTMTKADMYEKYENTDIYPIITDYETVTDIVEHQILSTRTGHNIATDTKKQTFLAILRMTHDKSPCQIDTDIRDMYVEKLREYEKMSNDNRNENRPIRGNEEYPNFFWLDAVEEYNKYITETKFDDTAKGRKDLKTACCVGLYVKQNPRRIQDYSCLQWYSKKPTELNNKNILFLDDDGKMCMSIDKYKTRWRVAKSNEKYEVLPRFETQLDPTLADLFMNYFSKAKIRDMSKLTTEEQERMLNFYVFHKDNKPNEPYDDNAFSKVLTSAFKQVFKKEKLSVNCFRHLFNTYISENLQNYTDKELQDISMSVGDKPRQLSTNLRYRITKPTTQDGEGEGEGETIEKPTNPMTTYVLPVPADDGLNSLLQSYADTLKLLIMSKYGVKV